MIRVGFLAAVAIAAGVGLCAGAAERTHTVTTPVRIVAQEGVTNAACLLEHRFGQVCEGKFLEGSGPVLEKGAWLLLDFGRELHGSVQIGSGAKSGKDASVRVRFGESVSEALMPLGEKGACKSDRIFIDIPASVGNERVSGSHLLVSGAGLSESDAEKFKTVGIKGCFSVKNGDLYLVAPKGLLVVFR